MSVSKTKISLGIIFSLIFFARCKENSRTEKRKLRIGIEASVSPFIEEQLKVFNAIYGPCDIIVEYGQATELIAQLDAQEIDLYFGFLVLDKDQKEELAEQKRYWKQVPIMSDAIALVASPSFCKDSLSLMEDWGSKKFLTLENQSDLKMYLFNSLSKPSSYEFETTSSKQVFTQKMMQSESIGILPMGRIKEFKGLKTLRFQTEKGSVLPKQSTVIDKSYPLQRLVLGTYNGDTHSLGHAFLRFVHSNKGQRILLKDGYAPVKIPGRVLVM